MQQIKEETPFFPSEKHIKKEFGINEKKEYDCNEKKGFDSNERGSYDLTTFTNEDKQSRLFVANVKTESDTIACNERKIAGKGLNLDMDLINESYVSN